jgi:hypothetical protein
VGPTDYHDVAAQIITGPQQRFTVGTRHSRLGALQTQTLPDKGNSVKDDDSSGHITHFQLSDIQALCAWHHHLHIWALLHLGSTFSNRRSRNCSEATVDVRFLKFTLNGFCGNKVFKKNTVFSPADTCAAVVLRFLEGTLLSVPRSNLFLSAHFRPWFLFVSIIRVDRQNLRNCLSRYT